MVEMYKQTEAIWLNECHHSVDHDFHSRHYLHIREKYFSQNTVKFIIMSNTSSEFFKNDAFW